MRNTLGAPPMLWFWRVSLLTTLALRRIGGAEGEPSTAPGSQLRCQNGTSPDVCLVTGNYTLTSGTVFSVNATTKTLLIRDATILGAPCEDDSCADGMLTIVAVGNVTFLRTWVRVARLNLTSMAGHILIDNGTLFDVTGLGPASGDTFPSLRQNGLLGNGAGHGGSGAYIYACRAPLAPPLTQICGQGFDFEHLSAPLAFGGASAGFSGSGESQYARGGGVISVAALQGDVLVHGSLRSDGMVGPHIDASVCMTLYPEYYIDCGPGGGAGGSISISSASQLTLGPASFLSAVGGDSADSGGGGGGMIALSAAAVSGFQLALVNLTGGITLGNEEPCPVGGTGLLWLQQTGESGSGEARPETGGGGQAQLDRVDDTAPARADELLSGCVSHWRAVRAARRRRGSSNHSWSAATRGGGLLLALPVGRAQSQSPDLPGEEAGLRELCVAQLPLGGVVDSSRRHTTAPTSALYCISSSDTMANSMPLMQTVLSEYSHIAQETAVVLTNCAWDVSSLSIFKVASLTLSSSLMSTGEVDFVVTGNVLATDSSRISTTATSQGLRFTSVEDLKLVSSIITGGTISINAGHLVDIDTNGYMRYQLSCAITAVALTVSNELSEVDVPSAVTSLHIQAVRLQVNSEGRMFAGRIYIDGGGGTAGMLTAAINGLVYATQQLDDDVALCPDSDGDLPLPAVREEPCVNDYNGTAGYTLYLSANTTTVQKSGSLVGAAMRVCASALTVDAGGIISGSSLGCAAESGGGAGSSSATAPSSGAGHGALGGDGVASTPSNTNFGGYVYDNTTFPRMLGSGGGGDSAESESAGGGFMWLEAQQLRVDGSVAVTGAAGAAAGGPGYGGGGGGGSGGSLVLVVRSLRGGGVFDTSGGGGASPGGGGGSGGIIHVAWRGDTPDNLFAGTLLNKGGLGAFPGRDGGHGTALSLPSCDEGRGGALCLPCNPGFYKLAAGNNDPCLPCAPGTHSNATGTGTCEACDSVSVAPSPGAVLCAGCPPGRMPNANHTECSLCAPGHGGPDCLPCDPGSFQANASTNACAQCAPGTAAPGSGATACSPCGLGRFCSHEGCSACDACESGAVSAPPWVQCTPCGAGSFATSGMCAGCPVDSQSPPKSAVCYPCELGSYSDGNASACTTCPAIPAHAAFLPSVLRQPASVPPVNAGPASLPPPAPLPGMCAFRCLDTYLAYPQCITLTEVAFQQGGGWPTLALALLAGAAAALPTLCSAKSAARSDAWVLGGSSGEAADVLAAAAAMAAPGGAAGNPAARQRLQVLLLLRRPWGASDGSEAAAYWGLLSYDDLMAVTRTGHWGWSALGLLVRAAAALLCCCCRRGQPRSTRLSSGDSDGGGREEAAAAAASGPPSLPSTGRLAHTATATLATPSSRGGSSELGSSRQGGDASFKHTATAVVYRQFHSSGGVRGAGEPPEQAVEGSAGSSFDGDEMGSGDVTASPRRGGGRVGALGTGFGHPGPAPSLFLLPPRGAGGSFDTSLESAREWGGTGATGASLAAMGPGSAGTPPASSGGGGMFSGLRRLLSQGSNLNLQNQLPQQQQQQKLLHRGMLSQPLLADSNSTPPPPSSSTAAAAAAASASRLAAGSRTGRSTGLGTVLTERLGVHELPRHLHRVYFSGSNSPACPLALRVARNGASGAHHALPLELAHVVLETEFAEHAVECNALARWRPWEARVANLLRLLLPPAALLFEARRRAVHVRALATYHTDMDHGFLRNTRARALGNCVRFGASRDNTCAYIDILVTDPLEDTGGAPVGQPRLPAVLRFAGDGSFAAPLRVDLEDPLTVSQLALVAPDFHSIVVALNDRLRGLRGPTLAPGLLTAPWVRSRQGAAARRTRANTSSEMLSSLADGGGGGFGSERAELGGPNRQSAGGRAGGGRRASLDDEEEEEEADLRGPPSGGLLFKEAFRSARVLQPGDRRREGGRGMRGSSSMDDGSYHPDGEEEDDDDGGDSGGDAAWWGRRSQQQRRHRPSCLGAWSHLLGCTSLSERANYGPAWGGAEQRAALMEVRALIFAVNAVLAHRTAAATAAVTALRRRREEVATDMERDASRQQQRGGYDGEPQRRASLEEAALRGGGGWEEEEVAAAEALHHVGFGFPHYECSLHLGRCEDGQLALVLLPRDAPPDPVTGKWPFFLPYGTTLLPPATVDGEAGSTRARQASSLGVRTDAEARGGARRPPSWRTDESVGVQAGQLSSRDGGDKLATPRRAPTAPVRRSSLEDSTMDLLSSGTQLYPPLEHRQQLPLRGGGRPWPTAAATPSTVVSSSSAAAAAIVAGNPPPHPHGAAGALLSQGGSTLLWPGSGGGGGVRFGGVTPLAARYASAPGSGGKAGKLSSRRASRFGEENDGASDQHAQYCPGYDLEGGVAWVWALLCAWLWPALHNTPVAGPFRSLLSATLALDLLVLGDLVLTALTLSGLAATEIRAALLCAALPPLLLPLTPLVGVAAVTSRSTALLRIQAVVVQQSLLPAALAFILSLGLMQALDYRIGSVIPLALLLVKLLCVPAIACRIAALDLQHDADRWAPEPVVFVRDLCMSTRNDAAAGAAAAIPHTPSLLRDDAGGSNSFGRD